MSGLATVAMPKPLRIKFVSKMHKDEIEKLWSPLLPAEGFPDVEFSFDASEKEYDFFAVYEGLPKWSSRGSLQRYEMLSCHPANTLLITTEPSSIRIDGPNFMRQFGHILTNKSPRLTRHPNHIRETPPLRWFYGRAMDGTGEHMSLDELKRSIPHKTKVISTVCSTKRMSHTVHAARLNFIMTLRHRMPELDVYGRGINPICDKAEAMRDYKYHIAIENHIESGHWTEKLADCFLAGCLPFYFGDPDYANTFPDKAVIPIDIFDVDSALITIRDAISTNIFEERQAALLEARKIVLDHYNTLGRVARFASENYVADTEICNRKIYSRHAFRRYHPLKALSDFSFRTRMKSHPAAQPIQKQGSHRS